MTEKTDRELLEAAAKAAGLKITGWPQEDYCTVSDGAQSFGWQPLIFDSDALRLAVKLRLDLFNYGEPVHDVAHVDAVHMDGSKFGNATEELGSDPYAATRRAIVRAAAATGATK